MVWATTFSSETKVVSVFTILRRRMIKHFFFQHNVEDFYTNIGEFFWIFSQTWDLTCVSVWGWVPRQIFGENIKDGEKIRGWSWNCLSSSVNTWTRNKQKNIYGPLRLCGFVLLTDYIKYKVCLINFCVICPIDWFTITCMYII